MLPIEPKRNLNTAFGSLINEEGEGEKEEDPTLRNPSISLIPDEFKTVHSQPTQKTDLMNVYLRIRPALVGVPKVKSTSSSVQEAVCLTEYGQHGVEIAGMGRQQPETYQNFAKVFGQSAEQKNVFEEVLAPMVTSLVTKGESGLLMAYGGTNAGKTHTIFGNAKSPGLIPQALEMLFTLRNQCISGESERKWDIHLSMFEFYSNQPMSRKENIYDLLGNTSTNKGRDTGLVVEDVPSRCQTFLKGLTSVKVGSCSKALDIVGQGRGNRTTRSTLANQASSRSHCAITFQLLPSSGKQGENSLRSDVETKEQPFIGDGRLTIIDLAGSERESETKNTGSHLHESNYINNSFLEIGKCFRARLDSQDNSKKPGQENFRNLNILWYLKYHLKGHYRTTLMVNVSPRNDDYNQTLQVLNQTRDYYGIRCIPPKPVLQAKPPPKSQVGSSKRFREEATRAAKNNVENISRPKRVRVKVSQLPSVPLKPDELGKPARQTKGGSSKPHADCDLEQADSHRDEILALKDELRQVKNELKKAMTEMQKVKTEKERSEKDFETEKERLEAVIVDKDIEAYRKQQNLIDEFTEGSKMVEQTIRKTERVKVAIEQAGSRLESNLYPWATYDSTSEMNVHTPLMFQGADSDSEDIEGLEANEIFGSKDRENLDRLEKEVNVGGMSLKTRRGTLLGPQAMLNLRESQIKAKTFQVNGDASKDPVTEFLTVKSEDATPRVYQEDDDKQDFFDCLEVDLHPRETHSTIVQDNEVGMGGLEGDQQEGENLEVRESYIEEKEERLEEKEESVEEKEERMEEIEERIEEKEERVEETSPMVYISDLEEVKLAIEKERIAIEARYKEAEEITKKNMEARVKEVEATAKKDIENQIRTAVLLAIEKERKDAEGRLAERTAKIELQCKAGAEILNKQATSFQNIVEGRLERMGKQLHAARVDLLNKQEQMEKKERELESLRKNERVKNIEQGSQLLEDPPLCQTAGNGEGQVKDEERGRRREDRGRESGRWEEGRREDEGENENVLIESEWKDGQGQWFDMSLGEDSMENGGISGGEGNVQKESVEGREIVGGKVTGERNVFVEEKEIEDKEWTKKVEWIADEEWGEVSETVRLPLKRTEAGLKRGQDTKRKGDEVNNLISNNRNSSFLIEMRDRVWDAMKREGEAKMQEEEETPMLLERTEGGLEMEESERKREKEMEGRSCQFPPLYQQVDELPHESSGVEGEGEQSFQETEEVKKGKEGRTSSHIVPEVKAISQTSEACEEVNASSEADSNTRDSLHWFVAPETIPFKNATSQQNSANFQTISVEQGHQETKLENSPGALPNIDVGVDLLKGKAAKLLVEWLDGLPLEVILQATVGQCGSARAQLDKVIESRNGILDQEDFNMPKHQEPVARFLFAVCSGKARIPSSRKVMELSTEASILEERLQTFEEVLKASTIAEAGKLAKGGLRREGLMSNRGRDGKGTPGPKEFTSGGLSKILGKRGKENEADLSTKAVVREGRRKLRPPIQGINFGISTAIEIEESPDIQAGRAHKRLVTDFFPTRKFGDFNWPDQDRL